MKPSELWLTKVIDHVNRIEADNFRKHCQELFGERWKLEWEQRRNEQTEIIAP